LHAAHCARDQNEQRSHPPALPTITYPDFMERLARQQPAFRTLARSAYFSLASTVSPAPPVWAGHPEPPPTESLATYLAEQTRFTHLELSKALAPLHVVTDDTGYGPLTTYALPNVRPRRLAQLPPRPRQRKATPPKVPSICPPPARGCAPLFPSREMSLSRSESPTSSTSAGSKEAASYSVYIQVQKVTYNRYKVPRNRQIPGFVGSIPLLIILGPHFDFP
jgi:hypothetical protein